MAGHGYCGSIMKTPSSNRIEPDGFPFRYAPGQAAAHMARYVWKGKMKQIAIAILLAATFGLGYWARGGGTQLEATIEDYALQNVLEALGYARYLENGKVKQARSLIDVNLSNHLQYVSRYQGGNESEGFHEAKARTLNAVALLWEEYPPVNPLGNQSEMSEEWKSIQSANLALLAWAKEQCAGNPGLECKTRNKAAYPTQ